ncbi:MAG: hypothetical protein KJ799_09445 [Bacteroidetes bacterium]|nr:hypothetical protein [Bacteroidota bacterium]
MKVVLKYISSIAVILSIISCESTTEPIKIAEKKPFMSLSVGDIRQYLNETEGFYMQIVVLDTTKRIDGKTVFALEESIIFPDAIFKATNYYFINSEYFIQTELDTVRTSAINYENPFYEKRLAKIYPNEGDYFLMMIGDVDSAKVFFSVNIIDSLETPAKTFKNVAEYKKNDSDTTRNLRIFYTQVFGHIGLLFGNQNGFAKVYATYLKVGTNELGVYIPFNYPNNQIRIKKHSIIRSLFLSNPKLELNY